VGTAPGGMAGVVPPQVHQAVVVQGGDQNTVPGTVEITNEELNLILV
jgi:hypothetical protein